VVDKGNARACGAAKSPDGNALGLVLPALPPDADHMADDARNAGLRQPWPPRYPSGQLFGCLAMRETAITKWADDTREAWRWGANAPPMPDRWPVCVQRRWLTSPRQYYHILANTTLSFDHALKRFYVPMLELALNAEAELKALFTEHPVQKNGKWGGVTYHVQMRPT